MHFSHPNLRRSTFSSDENALFAILQYTVIVAISCFMILVAAVIRIIHMINIHMNVNTQTVIFFMPTAVMNTS
ncbi:hypothetical protein Trydic_g2109 [Trypoxylus dichotomus]